MLWYILVAAFFGVTGLIEARIDKALGIEVRLRDLSTWKRICHVAIPTLVGGLFVMLFLK